jgi:NitT/TauT family transport system permease protein
MRFIRYRISRRTYFLLFPTSFLFLLASWSLVSKLGVVQPFFLPSPLEIIRATGRLFLEYGFFRDIWASVYRILWGFFLSVVLGVPVGLVIGTNRYAEAVIEPFIDFIRYMPVAGFIPLCILWFGIGDTQKIAIIFLGTFFQLVPMVMDATSGIPNEYLDTSRTLGARDKHIFSRVIIPYSLPAIYDAMRISMGIAWTYLVVAEIVAAGSGIGHVIIEAQRYLKTAHIFVGIITVGVLGLLSDYFFKLMQPILFPWRNVDETHV